MREITKNKEIVKKVKKDIDKFREIRYNIHGQQMLTCKNRQAFTNKVVVFEVRVMNLCQAEVGKEYIVQRIETDDEELDAFLFSLGCYSGEPITVISRRKKGCVVSIKDGRYNIDNDLAEAIIV